MSNSFGNYFSVKWEVGKLLLNQDSYIIFVVKNDKEGTGYFINHNVNFQSVVKFSILDGALLEWSAVGSFVHVYTPKTAPRVYADEHKPEYYETLISAIVNDAILEE